MSLGSCPECQKQVALSATHCLNCGNQSFIIAYDCELKLCSCCHGSGRSHDTTIRDEHLVSVFRECEVCSGSGTTSGRVFEVDSRMLKQLQDRTLHEIFSVRKANSELLKEVELIKSRAPYKEQKTYQDDTVRIARWKNYESSEGILMFFWLLGLLVTIPIVVVAFVVGLIFAGVLGGAMLGACAFLACIGGLAILILLGRMNKMP